MELRITLAKLAIILIPVFLGCRHMSWCYNNPISNNDIETNE